jgi:hypothetical protein
MLYIIFVLLTSQALPLAAVSCIGGVNATGTGAKPMSNQSNPSDPVDPDLAGAGGVPVNRWHTMVDAKKATQSPVFPMAHFPLHRHQHHSDPKEYPCQGWYYSY